MKKTYPTLVIAISAMAFALPSMKAQNTQPFDYLNQDPPTIVANRDLTKIQAGGTTYSSSQAPVTLALVLKVMVPSLASHANYTSASDPLTLVYGCNWYSWSVNPVTSVYTPTSFTQSTGTAIATTKYGNKEFLSDLVSAGYISSISGWSIAAIPYVDSNGIINYTMICSNSSGGVVYLYSDNPDFPVNLLQVGGYVSPDLGPVGIAPLAGVSSTTGGINLNLTLSNIKSTGSSSYYSTSFVNIGGSFDQPSTFVNPTLTEAQESAGVSGPLNPITLTGLYSASAANISWSTTQNSINILPVPGSASFDGLVGAGSSGGNGDTVIGAPVTVTGSLKIAPSKPVRGVQPQPQT